MFVSSSSGDRAVLATKFADAGAQERPASAVVGQGLNRGLDATILSNAAVAIATPVAVAYKEAIRCHAAAKAENQIHQSV